MKQLHIIAISLLFLIHISCHKDQFDPGTIDSGNPTIIPSIRVEKEINGFIMDPQGNPIIGSELNYYNHSISTGPEGFFKFKDLISINQLYMISKKANYFDAIIAEPISEIGADFVQLIQIPFTNQLTLPSNLGGLYLSSDGISIEFEKNSFLDSKKQIYQGPVIVSSYVLDPSHLINYQSCPFLAPAINSQNQTQYLKHLATAAIELRSLSGEILNLNKEATISIPPSPQLPNLQTSGAKSWYFDTNKKAWIENTVVTKNGNKYQFSSSSLSFLSVALSYEATVLEGSLKPTNTINPPLLKIQNLSENYVSIVRPNESGNYRHFLPKNISLNAQLIDDCQIVISEDVVGPFTSGLSKTNIQIKDQSINTLEGKLVDCTGSPIQNGIVYFGKSDTQNSKFLKADKNGNFRGIVDVCQAEEIEVSASDLNTSKKAKVRYFINSKNLNIGNIEICENTALENLASIQYDDKIRNITNVQITKAIANNGRPQIRYIIRDAFPDNSYVEYYINLNQTGPMPTSPFDEFEFEKALMNGNPEILFENFKCPSVRTILSGLNSGDPVIFNVSFCSFNLRNQTQKNKGTIRLEGIIM